MPLARGLRANEEGQGETVWIARELSELDGISIRSHRSVDAEPLAENWNSIQKESHVD